MGTLRTRIALGLVTALLTLAPKWNAVDMYEMVCYPEADTADGSYVATLECDADSLDIRSDTDVEVHLDDDAGPTVESFLILDDNDATFFKVDEVTGVDISTSVWTGTFVHENGGLEADVSAYNGLIRITGGATSNVTDLAGLNTAIGSGLVTGAHTATAITDGLIVEPDLSESSGAPTDNDVLTYNAGSTNFTWVAQDSLTVDVGTQQICIAVQDLDEDDDDMPFWSPVAAVTLSEGWCVCTAVDGSCTTEADITLEARQTGTASTVDAVGGTINCEDEATAVSKTTLTSDNTVDALDLVRFNVTNTPTPGDIYTLCVSYTVD